MQAKVEHPTKKTAKPEDLEHPRGGQVFRRGAEGQQITGRLAEEGGIPERHSVNSTIGFFLFHYIVSLHSSH